MKTLSNKQVKLSQNENGEFTLSHPFMYDFTKEMKKDTTITGEVPKWFSRGEQIAMFTLWLLIGLFIFSMLFFNVFTNF